MSPTPSAPELILAQELAAYARHKDAMLGSNASRWVLIKGDLVVAYFDTSGDAIEAGYRQFGNVPFLVKQILVAESVANFNRDLFAAKL
jgi:hypothetical protein